MAHILWCVLLLKSEDPVLKCATLSTVRTGVVNKQGVEQNTLLSVVP